MPVFQLDENILFPPPELAEPNGLLAIGGDLSVQRLLNAYQQGIFPWYSDGEPILWWSPSPRLVLLPGEFHLPKRLARTIRQNKFCVRFNHAFDQVIHNCAEIRTDKGENTWITSDMVKAYKELHRLGFAHSIECWYDDKLVGGLYGVCLDSVYFGESMFSHMRDASKVALFALVQLSIKREIKIIDCQVTTRHLLQFGSKEVSGETFQKLLKDNIENILPQKKWRL